MSGTKLMHFHGPDELCENRKGFSDYRADGSCVGHEVRVVKLGVIQFHTNKPLRERFFWVLKDLSDSGSIVDRWLMDIASVLKEFGYTLTITKDSQ